MEPVRIVIPSRTQAGEHRADAAAARRVGLPFEHTGRIQSLRDHLAAIGAELAPTPPAGSPVVRPDDAEQSPLRTKAPELPAQVSRARRMQRDHPGLSR